MKNLKLFFVAIVMMIFIVACTEAETQQAEQDIQEAVEQTGETIEEGFDDAEKEIRAVGEELDDAVDTDTPKVLEKD